jgi:hypothetical protein
MTRGAVQLDPETCRRQALDDLELRTLSGIANLLGQLVYIASTRDYNTGAYYHDGLAVRFDLDTAQAALKSCHWSLFRTVLLLPLSKLVDELVAYFDSAGTDPLQLLTSWQGFMAYRMLIPAECDHLSAGLFMSNMKVGLAILHMRILKGAELARQ